MAIFTYSALDAEGNKREGTIDAVSMDLAISALQRRGLIVAAIDPEKKNGGAFDLHGNVGFLERITAADMVMLSRQIATLFEAQVSALRAFRMLAAESRTQKEADVLTQIANDIQSGRPISTALSRHSVFSPFYVNMVRSGEETGKLSDTFNYLAEYIDRNYELTSKARNALIYPAFIIVTFGIVMTLMMTMVIPNLSKMLLDAHQQLPIYTQIVIGISSFMTHYILFMIIVMVFAVCYLVYYARTPAGRDVMSQVRLRIPAVGGIYRKIYLSRIADNLSTMLRSDIQILRALEITGSVVEDVTYERVLAAAAVDVKGGLPLSDALRKHPEIPGIIVAMIKIGEESGNIAGILETMARYYRREVNNAVDTLMTLIEPFIIVTLAVGVAVLLASVLMPIYNIASSI